MQQSLADYVESLPRILMVVTNEEDRLIRRLHDLAPPTAQVQVWNSSLGMMSSEKYIDEWTNTEGAQDTTTMQLAQHLLPEIYRRPGAVSDDPNTNPEEVSGSAYYILLDIDQEIGNGMVRRWLKNIAISGGQHPEINRTVVLVSQSGRVPPDLADYVERYVLDLPGPALIRDQLTKLEADLQGQELEFEMQKAAEEEAMRGRAFGEPERLELERNFVPEFTLPSDRKGDDIPESFVKACAGLTLYQIRETIIHYYITREGISTRDMLEYRRQVVSSSNILEFLDTDTTFDDVAGLDRQKAWLAEVGHCFSEEGRQWGLTPPKGLLQVGVPGCGKSLSAKAVSNEWELPLLRLDPGRVFSSRVGESELNMRRALSIVESCSPCVLWVDEIEKGFSGVESSNFSDGGITARIIGTFLTWFEEHAAEVFLIATSNDISKIPTEMISRFDEVFFVFLPDHEARRECFRIHLEKYWREPMGDIDQIDLDLLAAASDRMTGREIDHIVKEGIRKGFCSPSQTVSTRHLLGVVESKPPMVKKHAESVRELFEWVGYDEERDEGVRARFASSTTPGLSKGGTKFIDASVQGVEFAADLDPDDYN